MRQRRIRIFTETSAVELERDVDHFLAEHERYTEITFNSTTLIMATADNFAIVEYQVMIVYTGEED